MTTDAKDEAVSAPKRKLIEVALPLETINKESAREKSIRRGHPSTLHLWWARRPLAAARAVLFAQLVDDPSSHPDRFPTEEAQRAERERLHAIIQRLVPWENARDQQLLAEAHEEILKSTNGNPPPILDPFAGGGTIPLEAQRLGLEARASDLNPVAVLINKALIEIPPKFAGRPPVFPGLSTTKMDWPNATGMAADVRAYGEWMRDEAQRRIGHHYPKAVLDDGTAATVIAWIWARTVPCPNPACGIEMPLVNSWRLGKKKGNEAWISPIIVHDPEHPSGKRIEFEIGRGAAAAGPTKVDHGTVGRNGATCVACGSAVGLAYVRSTSRELGLGATLMAIVAEGNRRRVYLQANDAHRSAAAIDQPSTAPSGELFDWPGRINVVRYGLTEFSDLFTNRQLLTLTTLSDLVADVRERVLRDAGSSGVAQADSYADAVATYLGLVVGRIANRCSSQCIWNSTGEKIEQVFTRQALPMIWVYPEGNPFSASTGNVAGQLAYLADVLDFLTGSTSAQVSQADARDLPEGQFLISTDPPYYDNIAYSDLSDFFYVWLRRSLRDIHPDLLSTMLVPKAEELVANPYRRGGKDGARHFFEQGFREVFTRARETALPDYPITVYYAYKQAESSELGTGSTGWETLLDGMIRGGWEITATWPVRTERSGGLRDFGMNALASSVVLAARPRDGDAPIIDRRGLIAALHDELPSALRTLQQGAIAPVDLPQAAIGPGMSVFSRYSRVVEDDGSTMTVRTALARINEILDQVLSEQEGDFESSTRFAIAWYRQYGYTAGHFGDADNLARARNTAVDGLARDGILTSAAGRVKLISPATLPEGYDVLRDDRVSAWEVLHHLIAFLERDGLPVAGAFLSDVHEHPEIDVELVKELAFLLFSIAEKNGWTQDAIAFNTVATAWPDIVQAARGTQTGSGEQAAFAFDEED